MSNTYKIIDSTKGHLLGFSANDLVVIYNTTPMIESFLEVVSKHNPKLIGYTDINNLEKIHE